MAQPRHYSDDEMEEILKRAARKTSLSGSDSRERLARMAEELGISPEALAEAEAEFAVHQAEARERAEWDAERRQSFLQGFTMYVLINLLLAFISLRNGQSWFLFPLIGWGAGVAAHAWQAFGRGSSAEFEAWRTKRSTPPEVAAAFNALKSFDGDPRLYQINAIQHVREVTGMGLREAKEAVDAYNARLSA